MAQEKISKKVTARVTDYLDVLETGGVPIRRAFIFGSTARGSRRRDSDIDLCIISPAFRKMRDPLTYLWTHRRDNHVGIEPVGYTPEGFTNADPLAHEIMRTGIRVR